VASPFNNRQSLQMRALGLFKFSPVEVEQPEVVISSTYNIVSVSVAAVFQRQVE
jgi:hypothetical protein